ncbi:hypothetical protein [Actinokineospora enzanensis]|uniref:hypothetical protein n=1 Tax=Actinokineospora enzanensis TaxID=155975 RepID=UPI00036B4B8F|nr:hypothetical protein [Actinokineospora enzanensis]
MSTDEFEDLLRDALRQAADRAPGQARVRAALARPRKRWRWPPIALMAAIATTAAVVVVECLPNGTPSGTVGPAVPVATSTPLLTVLPPAPVRTPVTNFAPTWGDPGWLPSGMVETERYAAVDGSLTRVWSMPKGPTRVTFAVRQSDYLDRPDAERKSDPPAFQEGGQYDLVGGSRVWFATDLNGQLTRMRWRGASNYPVYEVTAQFLPDTRTNMLRVARSIQFRDTRPDDVEVFAAVGLPTELSPTGEVSIFRDTHAKPYLTVTASLDGVGSERVFVGYQVDQPADLVPGWQQIGYFHYRVTNDGPNSREEVAWPVSGRWLVLQHATFETTLVGSPRLIGIAGRMLARPLPDLPWLSG